MTGYLDIPSAVATVRRRGWVMALAALLAVLVAVGVSVARPNRYEARASLLFGATTEAASVAVGERSLPPGPSDQSTNLALTSLDSVVALAERRVGGVAGGDPRGQVSVAPEGDSGVFAVTARSRSARRAAALANAFAEAVVATRRQAARAEAQRAIDNVRASIRRRQAAPARASQGAVAPTTAELHALTTRLAQLEVLRRLRARDVQVVERATAPTAPTPPRTLHNAVIAGFLGLLLGLPLMLLVDRLDQRIGDEDQLTALVPAPVLARIPRARSKRPWPGHRDAELAEAFELLRMNLQLMRPQATSVIAVTSPADGDGKSTVVARLADCLTASGADVVAVDFEAVGFDVRGSVRELLDRMREKAEYVLVDTPSVPTVADASEVAAAADAVILVVDLARLRRQHLVAAQRQLAGAHAPILGIVVNRVRTDARAQLAPKVAARAVQSTLR